MPDNQTTPVDPELVRQLEAADKNQTIEAVFTLRPAEKSPLLDVDQIKNSVDRIVKSATKLSGQKVGDIHVMPYAQCFSISAPAAVVRAVLEHSEIASAMANVQSEDLAIEPVHSKTGKPSSRDGTKQKKGS